MDKTIHSNYVKESFENIYIRQFIFNLETINIYLTKNI